MKKNHSFFDPLNALVRKNYRVIVIVWVLVLLVSAPLVSSFFSSVSFNVSGSSLSVPNSESDRAQAVLNSQFPSMNFSGNSVIVVLQNQNVYSKDVRLGILSLNDTLARDPKLSGFTGITSIYSVEESLLDSTLPAYDRQVAQIVGQLPGSGNGSAAWGLASREVAEGVSSTFASSPLFTVNATSLYGLISGLNATSTTGQIHASVVSLLSTENFGDYPYRLASPLTQDFASQDGRTMIFDLGFSSGLSNAEIAQTRSQVHSSSLASTGTLYVTGGQVIAADFEATGGPALSDSIIPGVGVSLLVAGLLFLSPVAALVPLLIGGVAIGISLGSIYGLIVYVQNSQINFAVPFLMILTMLGLAVDYSVLQLRRTREELSRGKSLQESVAVSVRWAGQAVLTAGLTVVVAYIVLAVTRVPFFGAGGRPSPSVSRFYWQLPLLSILHSNC
ncbi:MAG TPA: MMPL family transporter [Nitrososphaerales archaeon]|nr:MMPL family transporter [Nitrososphaerales archaeon]